MKNRKYFLIILSMITSLLVLNVFVAIEFFQYIYENKTAVMDTGIQKTIDYNVDNDTILLNEIIEVSARSSEKEINTNLELTDFKGETKKLTELLNGRAKLVFDFEKINCNTCFEKEMSRILKFLNLIGRNNVIFIGNPESNREHNVLEKKYGISIYKKKESERFGIPVEDGYYPFICVIDSAGVTKGLYIPTTKFYSMGNAFYSIIYMNYFMNESSDQESA